jgi:hypothetical protein
MDYKLQAKFWLVVTRKNIDVAIKISFSSN